VVQGKRLIQEPEQKERDVMAVQEGPRNEFRPISVNALKQDIDRELSSQSGYKLRRISYASQIILIGVTAVAISFSLYTVMWLILNDTIYQITGRGYLIEPITWEDFFSITSNFYFWFGFIVLTFPIGMYVFAFLVYFDMLYDSRLVEISRILSSKSKLRNDFFTLYSNKFTPILKRELERQKKINAYKKIYDDISSRATVTHPEDSYNLVASDRLRRKARQLKRSVMTDLLQRLSIRLDESTINGYFFAFTLLEIVVSISFVIPALEFSQIGSIGTNLLTRTGEVTSNANELATIDTSGYLSFWAIEWAIFGAFVYSFISLMDRIPRKDMTPRFYLNIAFRYIFAIALASLFFLIYHQVSISSGMSQNSGTLFYGSIAALSFSIGMFPNRYFRLIGSFLGKQLGGQFSRDIPLEKFTGISTTEATRLWEEGIENVDQLADSSVQDLYAKTRFDPNRLRSLIGRAMLWKYVFGIENMLVLLKMVDKPTDEAAAKAINARLGEISACRFSDVQSLCAYLFSNPLESLFSRDIAEFQTTSPWACPMAGSLDKVSEKIHVAPEILTQVIAMAPFFYEQLTFIDTTTGMSDLVSDDLSE
jgi:hypothetical protein